MTKTLRNSRGNALILAVVLMASIGLASSAFFINQTSTATTTGGLFNHKRAFYAAEGTLLIAIKIAQMYLSEVTVPDNTALKARLAAELPALVGSEYIIDPDDMVVEFQGTPYTGPITTGTFKGMLAPQTTLRLAYSVKGREDTLTRSVINMEATMSLAQVSMFQFLYFIDLAYADFSPGPEMRLNGWVHANGDLCLSGALGLKIQQVTAAGRIMYGNDARCKYQIAGAETYIASGPNLSPLVRLTAANGNGCTNCGTTRMPWADYAPATWNGNAMDSAHGVADMVLPIPSGVQTQMGADGDDRWIGMSNGRNLRFIVDPLRTTDSEQVAKQKFAYKADIRIINGVWYLRDNADPRRWPGIPIWSDHPGGGLSDNGTPTTNLIGQDDLRMRWSGINPWGAQPPHRYSYYEYIETDRSISTDTNGVISYGTLFTGRNPAGGQHAVNSRNSWRPGHWLNRNIDSPCKGGTLISAAGGLVDAFSPLLCSSPGNPTVATAFLNATRSGFHDGHIYRVYPDVVNRQNAARVLPMNFDVEQFQKALSDTSPGELGSYFGAGRFMGAPFNGVVYITVEWPGSQNGFNPSDAPQAAPFQGTWGDTNQLGITAPATGMQQALPFPLCSGNRTWDFDRFSKGGSPVHNFQIPACSSYGVATRPVYPTAVRIINGYDFSPSQMTKGLSIVSNVGVYVQGEVNTISDTSTETATPWKPFLVTGDQINFLSNMWFDSNAAWDDYTHTAARPAGDTTYNMAVITGWARQSNTMTLHAFPSMMEDWRTATITFNGSIVVGYYPVYERYGKYYESSGYTYRSGPRVITYDRHLKYTANQPPGAPLFYISSLVDWKTN